MPRECCADARSRDFLSPGFFFDPKKLAPVVIAITSFLERNKVNKLNAGV